MTCLEGSHPISATGRALWNTYIDVYGNTAKKGPSEMFLVISFWKRSALVYFLKDGLKLYVFESLN